MERNRKEREKNGIKYLYHICKSICKILMLGNMYIIYKFKAIERFLSNIFVS